MAGCQTARTELTDTELKLGKEMVADYFSRKLDPGSDKTGRLGGWIMNPIFLREAERLVPRPAQE
jgi:hypothetical protein